MKIWTCTTRCRSTWCRFENRMLLQPETHREDLEMFQVQTAPPMDGCGLAHPFVFLLFLLSSSSSSNPSTYPTPDSLLHGCDYSLDYSHLCSSCRDMSESSHWRKVYLIRGWSDLSKYFISLLKQSWSFVAWSCFRVAGNSQSGFHRVRIAAVMIVLWSKNLMKTSTYLLREKRPCLFSEGPVCAI